MPRKLLIPTLILTASLASIIVVSMSPSAKAMVKKDDVLYWSFDEIVDFDAQIKAETEATCGADMACQEECFYRQKEQSNMPEKYQALVYFREAGRLVFSMVNPTNDMFRVYYRDKDETSTGVTSESSAIEEIYIAWVEDYVPDPRSGAFLEGDNFIAPYAIDMRNGMMSPGVHELFHGTSARYGQNWFSPYIKTTIDASGSHLKDNQNHLIHYNIIATNHVNLLTAEDYSSCFRQSDYEEGMECRIMYSGVSSPVYFPAYPWEENLVGAEVILESEPIIIEPEPESEPESESEPTLEPESEPTPISTPNPKVSEQVSVPNPPIPVIAQVSTLTAHAPLVSTSSMRVPETKTEVAPDITPKDSETPSVEVPLAAKNEEHQFPWWFIVFIFSGITLILWWCIPISRKKDKKSLDK